MRLIFWTGFWVFLLDQASKYYVVHMLKLDIVKRIEVWDPYLVLTMAWNKGVNFGIGANFDMKWLLIGLALAISVGVLWWLRGKTASRWTYIAAGCLIGGAIGNVIDRVIYGSVADFLNMSCCGIDNPFAFNVADVAIFVGAIGLAFSDPDKVRKKQA